ncbi:hypothetical protein AB1I63_05320 [Streptococcus pneumoniae]
MIVWLFGYIFYMGLLGAMIGLFIMIFVGKIISLICGCIGYLFLGDEGFEIGSFLGALGFTLWVAYKIFFG